MFEICLIGDDVAGFWIDKHEWTIQAQAPRLPAVTIRSLLELPKILRRQFGVDAGRLCRRARDDYEQAQDNQHESRGHFTDTMYHLTMPQEMIPTSEQVNDARELLRRFLRPTRLVPAERIGRETDTRIYLKLEADLPTGSFKPRGAIYALMKTLQRRSIKGVVA